MTPEREEIFVPCPFVNARGRELYFRGYDDGNFLRPLIISALPQFEQGPYTEGVLDGRKERTDRLASHRHAWINKGLYEECACGEVRA